MGGVTIIESIILGFLQGATEFLPVSSSGHLVVARHFMDIGQIPALFDILLHLATLLAVVIVFRRRIGELLTSLWQVCVHRADITTQDRENLHLLSLFLIATLVTAAAGLVLERLSISFSAGYVGVFFVVTALILFLSAIPKGTKGFGELKARDALVTGLAQGLAVLPGISRSGITITASLSTGLDRTKAGEYSFLLSIPAILGALVLEFKDFDSLYVSGLTVGLGMATAFVVGLASLFFLLRLIRRGRLYLFGFYLIPVGILTIVRT